MWRKQQEEGERHDFDDSVDFEASKTKTPFQYEEPCSWEEQAFAEDAAGRLGGCVWPPRSYSCSFCRREFRSAQALGGHMNVHRRDRARLKQSPNPFTNSLGLQSPAPSSSDHHLCTLANYYLPNPKTYSAADTSSPPPNSVTSYGGRSDSLDGTKKLRISCPRVRVDHHKDHDDVGIGILDEGLSFSFGQPQPLDDGRKEAGAVSRCKRRKTDDETSIQFYVKSSSLVETHHHHHIHQSEVIGLSSGSLHDLDLELRLGGLSKG